MTHIPDVFVFMSRLKNQTVFNFCSIPQVMAIATLSMCYDNHNVFTGVVKIRKGTAVSLMLRATNMPALYHIFYGYVSEIKHSVPENDPSAAHTLQVIKDVEKYFEAARLAGLLREEVSAAQAFAYFSVGVAVGLVIRPSLPRIAALITSAMG